MVRVRQMMLKLRYRAVSRAFETWLGLVAATKTAALVAEKEADRAAFHAEMRRAEELRHHQVLSSSAQHMMKRGVSKCFGSWLGWVTEKVAIRSMLRKIVLRIQNMYVGSAFGSWQSLSCHEPNADPTYMF